MKHIKVFEKWGINQEVEDSAKYYVQQMLNEPNKNKYTFTYYSSKGDYDFDIIIYKFKDKNKSGDFEYYHSNNSDNKTSDYTIRITKRDDIGTLIHELKHFDRHLRKGINTDMLSVGTNIMHNMKTTKQMQQIFYLFNIDEFEARYHEYYSEIDDYLSKNLKENPTNKEVVEMINYYLKHIDNKTYLLWKIDFNIDILNNSNKKELIKLFNKILDNKPLLPIVNFNDLKGTYKSLVRFIKSEIGMEVTPENFNKLVKKLNSQINKNKEKFNKKFNRLYSIMVDKYTN
jgi:hypothetical protein